MDKTRRTSPLLPIFLIVLVDILGLTIILPLLPFYAEHFGASPLQVGLLVSTYAACQFFSSPLIGRWSDHIGRKPMLLLSQLGTFSGFILLANAWSLPIVFLSRMIDGSTAGNISVAQAYIADVTEPSKRARAFALIGISFGLGFLVGPAVSGVLAGFGNVYPIYAAAALSATSILATALLLPGGRPERQDEPAGADGRRPALIDLGVYTRYFARAELRPYLLQLFLFFCSFSMFTSGIALFAERRFTWSGHPFGAREVGFIFAYTGFLGLIWQGGVVHHLVARFGETRVARAGFGSAALGLAILAFVGRIPTLLVAGTITSFGVAVLRPALMSLISQNAGKHEQGAVIGLTSSLNSIAAILAPFLAGFLIDHGWLTGWGLVASAAAAGGLALAASVPADAPAAAPTPRS